ncbi:alpha/beta-hydrolase [Thozetella sp. PMI_491]|nr:alpha/beta-hydrolase [Thozetella sp. PMI_491]
MGLFSRSSKVSKETGSRPPKDPRSPPPQYHQSPPPPPPLSQVSQPWYPDSSYQSLGSFQPAGLLPPPSGWTGASVAPPPYQQPPIIVNQHYYITPQGPPVPPRRPHTSSGPFSKAALASVVNLADDMMPAANFPQLFDDGLPSWHGYKTRLVNQSAALCDQISSRFGNVMTLIDRDGYEGNEKDLFVCRPGWQWPEAPTSVAPSTEKAPARKTGKSAPTKDHPKGQTTAVAASVLSGDYFAKVELYANSKLPMKLPPLDLYVNTYPLLCLAARYAERVYETPKGAERDTHVDADWRTGAKAMVIKSVPMDYEKTIVFAIRGTATFMDWAVNLNMAPTSPYGFLDDPGNFCHAGFLSVARKMIQPVAKRLRQLLEEDPSRASYSLMITGHSAGGAVAALLYSHMYATSKAAESELNLLTGCFKRIHCVTFGTPPVSLLPLVKPADARLKKSIFLSFINEGDPVARADKAYVKSLLELFAAPAPIVQPPKKKSSGSADSKADKSKSSGKSSKGSQSKTSLISTKTSKSSKSSSSSSSSTSSKASGPVWTVPPCTLSCAGRIVVLRSGDPKARIRGKKTVEERLDEGVVAQIATDEQLRSVIWGDPVCHVMRLYALRIETLAVGAITAQGY